MPCQSSRYCSRATRNLYSVGKIYIASALLYSVPAFRVKLGANDLNSVDVLLNPTHSLTHCLMFDFLI